MASAGGDSDPDARRRALTFRRSASERASSRGSRLPSRMAAAQSSDQMLLYQTARAQLEKKNNLLRLEGWAAAFVIRESRIKNTACSPARVAAQGIREFGEPPLRDCCDAPDDATLAGRQLHANRSPQRSAREPARHPSVRSSSSSPATCARTGSGRSWRRTIRISSRRGSIGRFVRGWRRHPQRTSCSRGAITIGAVRPAAFAQTHRRTRAPRTFRSSWTKRPPYRAPAARRRCPCGRCHGRTRSCAGRS